MAFTVQGNTVIHGDRVIQVAAGNTASRPASPAQGMIRYNTTDNSFEGYNGTAWGAIGGGGGGANAYSVNIGNGSSNSITVTHNLNTNNVLIAVRQANNGLVVYPDIVQLTSNTARFDFITAPASNAYTVVILGA